MSARKMHISRSGYASVIAASDQSIMNVLLIKSFASYRMYGIITNVTNAHLTSASI